ncbi:GNAT family N-acetyltransferase [Modestobacter versicolor]|uniref:GNAT family N-acetyltransferase n=1 Tax=Modestobacter versicolor TaxID=429133 RepID=UPI0034DF8D86
MTTTSTDLTVTRHPDRRRYEASAGGATVAGSIDYQETSELVVLTHTEVDASFEGRGVGSALARAALDDVRHRGLKALVICPFILGWLRDHREYGDVLFNAPPAKASD